MIKNKKYTDHQRLAALLIEAVLDAERLLGRQPTRDEVMTQLFPSGRGDPEAEHLSGMLQTLLDELLADWYEPVSERVR